MDKTFPCREDLSLTRVSSGMLFALGFWFPLRLYQVSNVCNKFLGPGLTHCRPMGLDLSGPMWWRFVMLIFAPLVAPFTLWVCHDLDGRTFRVTVWYYLGLTVQEYLGRRFKILEVDGSPGGHELRPFDDRLSSIYEHATCHFSIGFCIRSKRRFVFCALQVYI